VDRLTALLLLACMVCAACWTHAEASTPPRIVSLAPHLTEILFAAGAGARVVGTTEFSDHPEAARQVPRVGDAFRLDFERIVALRPDVAVAWESGTPAQAVERLRSLGIDVLMVRTNSPGDVADALESLGRLAGTGPEARAAAARLRADLEALRREHAATGSVRVFVEIDHDPLYTVSGSQLISQIVSLCGGENVFAELEGVAPAVDLEAVVARDPELILSTVGEGDPATRWKRWSSLAAVRLGLVFAVSPDELTRPSPRIVTGARAVCEAVDEARRRLGRH
jgi:iron complex transport system substrate-binding protein